MNTDNIPVELLTSTPEPADTGSTRATDPPSKWNVGARASEAWTRRQAERAVEALTLGTEPRDEAQRADMIALVAALDAKTPNPNE